MLGPGKVDPSQTELTVGDQSSQGEDEEWSDSDIPESEEGPLDEFVYRLEQKMICNQSRFIIRTWAKTKYGVEKDLLDTLMKGIRQTWALEAQDPELTRERRDDLRRKLCHVFSLAIEKDDMKHALIACKQLAELDSLVAPDINLTQVNIAGQVVTNKHRERITELFNVMRSRALRNAQQRVDLNDGLAKDLVDSHGNGHKNGNGSNGHK